MHEMSLAEGMLQLVEDGARRNKAAGVKAVRLEIGELAQVEIDALRFCFDAVTRGSLAEGARLEILQRPGAAWCLPCAERVPLPRRGDPCPRCGSHQLQVVQGEEMRVTEIEVV